MDMTQKRYDIEHDKKYVNEVESIFCQHVVLHLSLHYTKKHKQIKKTWKFLFLFKNGHDTKKVRN